MNGKWSTLRIPGKRFRSIVLWSSSFSVEVRMIRISIDVDEQTQKEIVTWVLHVVRFPKQCCRTALG